MDKGWNDRENGEGGQQKSPRSMVPQGLRHGDLPPCP